MKRTLFGLGIMGLTAFSTAGLNFTGVNDYSSELSTNPGGRVDAEIDFLTSGLFINSASFGSGNLATSGFQLDTFNTNFQKLDGSGNNLGGFHYDWGTELASGFAYRATSIFDGLFGFYGTASGPGVYTGTVDIFGGSTDTSSDLLGTANVSIEVVNGFGITVSYPQSSFTVNPGETQTLQHTLQNNSNRAANVQTRYYSNSTAPQGFTVDFVYNGYPNSLGANSSQTAGHMVFTGVDPSGPVWTANSGVFVGYYADDLNSISGGDFTVQSVPEPATLAVLGFGGALIARRRRKSN
jgi:hypothetical protein